MAADLVIYGLVAAGLVFWLRSILGTRNGEERDRSNPFLNTGEKRKDPIAAKDKSNVVSMSDGMPLEPVSKLEKHMTIAAVAQAEITAVAKADKSFSVSDFMKGAQDAFIMIVESFSENDKETLKGLLAEGVYKAFEAEIDRREKAGETVELEIHAVRKMELVEAHLDKKMAYLTVRFVADETNVVRDKKEKLLSGNPERVTETIDIWTFGRNIKSSNPAWLVYETRDEDAADDDHKTVPDSEK